MTFVLTTQMPYVASGKLSVAPFVVAVNYLNILSSTLCKTKFLGMMMFKAINYKTSDISKDDSDLRNFIEKSMRSSQNTSDITVLDTHICFKNVHATHLVNTGLADTQPQNGVCVCVLLVCVYVWVCKQKKSSEGICKHTSGWVSQLPTHNIGTAVVPVS